MDVLDTLWEFYPTSHVQDEAFSLFVFPGP